ncbi:hypothetical protein MAR_033190 [Mya arenaria]|uniref:Uncharacterized protein n=1 Tax=Mya arenaria TaxID=6604 RepID=A0ABY7G893_MYAAR|nr:hypothetical protein MAR_033190 [Mya arenaria]
MLKPMLVGPSVDPQSSRNQLKLIWDSSHGPRRSSLTHAGKPTAPTANKAETLNLTAHSRKPTVPGAHNGKNKPHTNNPMVHNMSAKVQSAHNGKIMTQTAHTGSVGQKGGTSVVQMNSHPVRHSSQNIALNHGPANQKPSHSGGARHMVQTQTNSHALGAKTKTSAKQLLRQMPQSLSDTARLPHGELVCQAGFPGTEEDVPGMYFPLARRQSSGAIVANKISFFERKRGSDKPSPKISKQLQGKISFSELPQTHEYEGEESALANYLIQHPEEKEDVLKQEEEVVNGVDGGQEDLLNDSPRNPDQPDTSIKANTVISHNTGALTSYKSKMQTEDFQFGMRLAEPEPVVMDNRDEEVDPGSLQLLPASESEVDAFSRELGTVTDMLF